MAEIKKYIFPKFVAEKMAKIDMRTQLEASMMSMSLMMVGMIVTIFYFVLYYDFPLWYKFFLGINAVAGIVFMSSYLVTTFQQYQSYLNAINFQQEMKGGLNEDAKEN